MGFKFKFNSSEGCENATLGPEIDCYGITCYHGTCVGRMVEVDDFHPFTFFDRCDCIPGWIGTRCDQCCKLPCVNDANCEIDASDDKQFCSCNNNNNYTGPYCEDLVPSTTPYTLIKEQAFWSDYTIITVSIPVVLTVLMIIMAVLLPYILYKKRHIFVLKIMYRFKTFEDDDSRAYDVFLSYRTSNVKDRSFVVHKLLKVIENWGLTACIDERDFVPGAAICETIKIAIKESRRTILVLSPAYIKGEWPEFEVQCAIMETLTKAHRIIPIILEPIDDCKKQISPSLSHILESITYIKWPQDEFDTKSQEEFWRRLKLSLPKKKKKNTVTNSNEKGTTKEVVSINIGKKEGDSNLDKKKKGFWSRIKLSLPFKKKNNKDLHDVNIRNVSAANEEKEVNSISKAKRDSGFITDFIPGQYMKDLLFPPGHISSSPA